MIVDSARGYATYNTMPADAAVLTGERKVNVLSPAQGERLVARGGVFKPGRTLMVCQGDVYVINNGREQLAANMLATLISREGCSGLVG